MPPPREFHSAMRAALSRVSQQIFTLDRTASTNDDAHALARDGAPDGTVVVADQQSAGRGRLGRSWWSEPGVGLLASWVVRPSLPVERWTIVPLLAGVAAVRAVRHRTTVPASLKWPNDLLVGDRKLGGILSEAEVPDYIVVGLGVNVSQTAFPDEIAGIATSIAAEGGRRLDRADLLAWTLRYFAEAMADPDAALEFYRRACVTLGRRVRVQRGPAGDVEGEAVEVDASGALVVDTGSASVSVSSGDVVHVRPTLPVKPLPPGERDG